LAVALAEMALAGGLGADISLRAAPRDDDAASDLVLLFSESPTRFLLEVTPTSFGALSGVLGDLPFGKLGAVSASHSAGEALSPQLTVRGLLDTVVINASVARLKAAWQSPLWWS
jgi:phosphoribosylformylglycinamidine synthase